MDAVRYHEHGDESVMQLETVEKPTPGPTDALVEIRAVGVNPVDAKIREGALPAKRELPQTVGTDLAGRVTAVGDKVEALEPGDRVYGTGFGWHDPGTYAEYAAVPADRLAPLPESVSFRDGAAVALVGATAWQALVRRGSLTVGDTCLIHGGTGGVGHVAVQIAVGAGCQVVATARAGRPLEIVENFGAVGVNYRSSTFPKDLETALDGRLADLVLETHASENLTADLHVTGRDSTILLIGTQGPLEMSGGDALGAMLDRVDVRFSSIMTSPEIHREALGRLGQLLADGTVTPLVAESYGLVDAAAALEHAQTSGVLGKVVIELDS